MSVEPQIYSFDGNHLNIHEGPSNLTLEASEEFNSTYEQYLAHVGTKGETKEARISWKLPKTPQTIQVLQSIIGFDISTKYTFKEPETISVGGMSFPPLSSGGTSTVLPGMVPFPTAQTSPFPSTTPGTDFGSGGSPSADRLPAKLLGGGDDKGWWIYDYTPPSIAVFISKSVFEQGGNTLLTQAGGKSTHLTPDGPGTISRQGWIFAKSNEKSMTYLSQMLGIDIKTLADFSQVKPRGQGWGKKASTYSKESSEAQVVSGPFTDVSLMTPEQRIQKALIDFVQTLGLNQMTEPFSFTVTNQPLPQAPSYQLTLGGITLAKV
jgi:hypothetical protein